MTLTLDELLTNLKDQYGSAWHWAAINRFSWLHTSAVLGTRETEEYLLLKQWLTDMVARCAPYSDDGVAYEDARDKLEMLLK